MRGKRVRIGAIPAVLGLAVGLLGSPIPVAGTELSVPHYWQDGAGWCWAASAAMMHKYFLLTMEDIAPGYQAKPWHIAHSLHKGKSEGANVFECLWVLKAGDPLGSYKMSAVTWDLVDVANIVIQLTLNKPVYGFFQDIGGNSGHVVVLTGYTGLGSDDHVYVNDPSGALFFKPGYDLCHVPVTWADFFDAIDQTDWSLDGWLLYPSSLLRGIGAGTKGSIDLCPKSWHFSTVPGIVAEIDADNQLSLDWDGKNHPGYYFVPSSSDLLHQPDTVADGVDYGALITTLDTLKVTPVVTNATPDPITAHVQLSVQHKGATVAARSAARVIDGHEHLTDDTLFELPVSDFATFEDGVYSLVLNLEVGGAEQDEVRMDFYIKDSALARGIRWLQEHQLANGSWDNDPAYTAMASLALLNAGFTEQDDAQVASAIAYIRGHINQDGSVYNVPYRYTYYTSLCILPLVATHNSAYHDDIGAMRNWLICPSPS